MLNVAVVGSGQWGANHIRVFSSLPGSRVVGAVDVDPQRLARVQEQFPSVSCAGNARDLFADPQIDAVVIAAPARDHYALASEALQAGKHVLCEKPLCLRASEGQELVRLAQTRQRILMVGHVFLFNSGVIKLKELMQSGGVGRAYYLSAVRTNLGPIRGDVNAAYDLAAHDISIFNWLLDSEPESVSATGSAFLQPGFEDVVFITLRYPGNILANIQASWLSPKKIRQITLVGSEKMVTWDDLELNTPVTIFDRGAGADREYSEYGEFLRISMWDGDVRLPKIQMEEPLKVQNRSFLRAIEQGRVERSGGEFATGVVRVLEAVEHSLKNSGAAVMAAR